MNLPAVGVLVHGHQWLRTCCVSGNCPSTSAEEVDTGDAAPGTTGIFEDSGEGADFKFSEDEMDATWRKFVTQEYPLLARPQKHDQPLESLPRRRQGKRPSPVSVPRAFRREAFE